MKCPFGIIIIKIIITIIIAVGPTFRSLSASHVQGTSFLLLSVSIHRTFALRGGWLSCKAAPRHNAAPRRHNIHLQTGCDFRACAPIHSHPCLIHIHLHTILKGGPQFVITDWHTGRVYRSSTLVSFVCRYGNEIQEIPWAHLGHTQNTRNRKKTEPQLSSWRIILCRIPFGRNSSSSSSWPLTLVNRRHHISCHHSYSSSSFIHHILQKTL